MGALCSIQSGKSDTKDAVPDGQYAFFDRSKTVKRSSRYLRDCEALIIPGEGTEFLPRHYLGKFDLHQRAYALFDFSPEIDVRFLFHFLHHAADYFPRVAVGATVKSLRRRHFEQLPVSVTDISTQRRIVAILDEAFEGIATAKANAEKNLQNARELFDGYLQAIFSEPNPAWVHRRLQDVCAKITDGTHQTPKYFDSGVVFLSSRNVTSGKIDWENIKYIDELQHIEMHRRVAPRVDDILLAKNGTTGVAAIVDRDTTFDIYVSLALIRSLGEVLPRFLLRFINSPAAKLQFNKRLKGVGVPNLHLEEIREVTIQFPASLEEQQKVIDRVDELHREIEAMELIQQRKLAALDELKKSLLHQAFAGQLTATQQASVVLQSVPPTTTPEFTANVIALAQVRHERQRREKTFGHVKEQKLLHLVESIGKIDLGRQPMRDAAGPNDFQHMLKAEEWAKAHHFFEMAKRGEGYEFRKLSAFDEHLSKARRALGPYLQPLERVIDLLVPMDTEEAEVFATVHAAWNNLLIDGAEVTDEAIVSAAREGWHPDKLEIPVHKFQRAIELIRQQGLVPDGTAKYVGGQQRLL